MPETIYGGYLQAQQREQEEEELAEEKKFRKLEESLNQLRMKKAGREMERDVEEWKYQQRLRQEKEEALLALPEEQRPYARLGLKMPETEEPPYPWMGTPYEKAGARKEFYIRPEKLEKETKPKRMTSASYKTQASSLEAQAGKSTDETEIKVLFERAKALREEANKLFRQEQQRAGMLPPPPPHLLDMTKLIEERSAVSPSGPPIEKDLEKALGGFLGEEGGEHPEEDAYIQQVESYLSDYDIDWDVIAESHPDWDIEYMKTKLGEQ